MASLQSYSIDGSDYQDMFFPRGGGGVAGGGVGCMQRNLGVMEHPLKEQGVLGVGKVSLVP